MLSPPSVPEIEKFFFYSFFNDLVESWVDDILMDKLADSMTTETDKGGDRIVRLMNGLSHLCVCKGEPQRGIQGE